MVETVPPSRTKNVPLAKMSVLVLVQVDPAPEINTVWVAGVPSVAEPI
jgi:hypothetical protein